MALLFYNSSSTNSRLKAKGFKIIPIHIFDCSPMGEKKFHICDRDALYRIEVTDISVFLRFYYLVKQLIIGVLCAQCMQYLREILYIDCPPVENHPLMNLREQPPLDETMEPVQQGRLSEVFRKSIKVRRGDRTLVFR